MVKFATYESTRRPEPMKTLDRIDEKLIAVLQKNNQLTCEEMAALVSVSPSTCRRRLDALRRNGVVIGDVSIINPELMGDVLTIIVLVTLERETPDGHAGFRRAMRTEPQVTECHFVAGTCDYVVQLNLKSMAQYDALVERLFTADPLVKRVDSLVVMNTVKSAGLRVPEPDRP